MEGVEKYMTFGMPPWTWRTCNGIDDTTGNGEIRYAMNAARSGIDSREIVDTLPSHTLGIQRHAVL